MDITEYTPLHQIQTSISILAKFNIKMQKQCIILLKYHTQHTNPIVLINSRCECIDLTVLVSSYALTSGLIAIELSTSGL